MSDYKDIMDDISYYLTRALLVIAIMITTPVWIIPYGIYNWLQQEDSE